MSADFVPFIPALRQRDAAAVGFSPASAAPQPAAPPPTHTHEPRVELKRDGERITQIQITCRCGEVIRVDCEY